MTFRFHEKGKAPKPLREWLADQSDPQPWEALPTEVKAALRRRLERDQLGFCCYCYVRVKGDHRDHIEHIEPQSDQSRFDWSNLALACEGGSAAGEEPHCDHSKGDQVLNCVHPYRNPVTLNARLRSSGKLAVDDPTARGDVEDVLRLNARRLVGARKAALTAALSPMPLNRRGRRHTEWRSRDLAEALRELPTESDYAPLVGAWLERRRAR